MPFVEEKRILFRENLRPHFRAKPISDTISGNSGNDYESREDTDVKKSLRSDEAGGKKQTVAGEKEAEKSPDSANTIAHRPMYPNVVMKSGMFGCRKSENCIYTRNYFTAVPGGIFFSPGSIV